MALEFFHFPFLSFFPFVSFLFSRKVSLPLHCVALLAATNQRHWNSEIEL